MVLKLNWNRHIMNEVANLLSNYNGNNLVELLSKQHHFYCHLYITHALQIANSCFHDKTLSMESFSSSYPSYVNPDGKQIDFRTLECSGKKILFNCHGWLESANSKWVIDFNKGNLRNKFFQFIYIERLRQVCDSTKYMPLSGGSLFTWLNINSKLA